MVKQAFTNTREDRRLIQWVLLDGNEQRLQSLADRVFRDLFNALRNLAGEVAAGHDLQPLVISMIGLVIYPFEAQAVRRFLPGYQLQQEDLKANARHVVGVLRTGLGGVNEKNRNNAPSRANVRSRRTLLHNCKG